MIVHPDRFRWLFGAALLSLLVLGACDDEERVPAPSADQDSGVPDTGEGSGDGGEEDTSAEPEPEPVLTDQPDGAPCLEDGQCTSGTCLTALDGFPGGFCTYFNCESRRDCAGPGRACLRGEFNGNLCVNLCERDSDCRPGYECVGQGTGSYCFPAYAGDALQPVCDSEFVDAEAVRIPTGRFELLDRHEVRFTIDPGTTSFMMVAWDRRHTVYPEEFIAPDGTRLSILEYAGYAFSPITFRTVAPVLFPGGPQFRDFVQPGEYVARFGYGGPPTQSLCHILIQESEPLEPSASPLVMDINFYFVGVPGLNAENATRDEGFVSMLDAFDEAYAEAGISLGDIRYFDVTGDVQDRFQVLRTQQAVFDMVELSRQPGETRSELLSANVFFVRGFSGEMASVLGVSAGIPGAAGVHGSQGTGLVFSASSLQGRGGPALVGQTLAHEVGHFVGLFHTTEQRGGGADQLDDTPECPPEIGGGNPRCPDATNLMFPIALQRPFVELSPGQILIVRANPLTKPVSRAQGGQ
jgi:hypothetical protein